MSVTTKSVNGELVVTGDTDGLWRISFLHGDKQRFYTNVDNYDRVYDSDDEFLVVSTVNLEKHLNRLLELYPDWNQYTVSQHGPWRTLRIEAFPFGPRCGTHDWDIKDNKLEFPNSPGD